MRDQLKRLEALQVHDAKIAEITEQLDAIPRKIQATENDLARVEGLLSSERVQLEEARKYLNEQKHLLEMETIQVSTAKQKLSQAKAPREAAAAQREIEQTRDMAQSREAEIKKLVEAITAKEKILEERGAEVQALRDAVTADKQAADEKISTLHNQAETLKQERNEITAQIPENILKRYGVIRKRKGQAISAVRDGTCTACNMNIPPQLFNNLRRANSIESCPYCLRIVYWEDIMKDGEDAAPSNGEKEPAQAAPVAGAEAGIDS